MKYMGKDDGGFFYYDPDKKKMLYGSSMGAAKEVPTSFTLDKFDEFVGSGKIIKSDGFSTSQVRQTQQQPKYVKSNPSLGETPSSPETSAPIIKEFPGAAQQAKSLSKADKDEIVGAMDPSDTAMTQISGKSAEDVYADQMKIAQGKDLAIKMGIPMAISAGIDLANLVMPTETEKKLQESIDALAGEDTDAEADKFERDSTQQMRAAITEARQREEARSAALGGERLTAAGDIQRGREASRDAMARGVTDIRERANRMRSEAATDVERRRLSAELQKASIADQKRQQFLQGLTSSGALLASAVAGVPMEGPASPETLAELGLTADQYSRVMAVLGQNKFRTRDDAYLALEKAGMKPSAILKILESSKLVR